MRLDSFLFFALAAAQDVIDVVVETKMVTVIGTGGNGYYHWRGHQPTSIESAPLVFSSTDSAIVGPAAISTTSSSSSLTASSTTSAPATITTSTSSAVTTSTPTSSATASMSPSDPLESSILNSTNFWRSQYLASPVSWNPSLAAAASAAATPCYFKHSGQSYGENIAAAWPSLSAQDGIDMWGSEESQYDYSNPGFTESTGHFTQLVWQATTEVGCALISCHNSDTANGGIDGGDFLVCEYSPRGNIIGDFAQNVQKAGMSARGVLGLGERSANAAGGKKAWGWMALAAVMMGVAVVV